MRKAIQIAYNGQFEMKCRFAAAAGFRHMSVNLSEVLGKTEDDWKRITEDIRRILDETGLACVQSHPYYYDLRISSELEQEEYEFAITQAIIASGKLGAKWCALHPRSSLSTGRYTRQSFEDNRRKFSEYLELAARYDTGIAAENLPIFAGILPVIPFYSCNYDDLCELTDSFADDRMGICWDFGHANLMRMDQAQALRYLGKRVRCTHVHNNFHRDDEHLPPDQGDVPWDRVMPALAEAAGNDVPLTLETHCRYDDPALLESFARHNYACLVYLEKLAAQG